MGNLDFSANADQLKELVVYIASQINVPTIGIGGGYAPIGTIISVMGTTAPQDYLACDGTVYNIADYPQLADYFESQFGESNHFGGNGTTTFAVPDLQGEFLRGTGTNSHTGNGNGGNVGEHQDATGIPFAGIWNSTVYLKGINTNADNAQPSYMDSTQSDSTTNFNLSASRSTINGTKNYTSRPTNTSVLYCIKAVVAGEVYSTEERVVGTWIDGKKIYQKTVDFESTLTILGSGVNISQYISALNIETIINCHGNASNSSNNNNYSVSTHLERSQGAYILYAAGGNTSSWLVRYLTVQYTKTTD
jgi:microcystin-dependent protein